MKNLKILVLLVMPFIGFSQKSITGIVMDNYGPLPYANVILLDSEGHFLKGTTTSETGKFELSAELGTFNLTVSYIGYFDFKKAIVLENDLILGNITLQEDLLSLDEVTITSVKKLITRKVDRLVFNIEDNPMTSGGDAMDVLKVAPGLVLEQGQITMIGKSKMRVMIDGRISQLSGDDLASFLISIPADDIKEIEIITNPPARYEAEGNSGIVNIVFKKGRNNSWKNRTAFVYTQATYANYKLNNSFNYRKDRLNLAFSINAITGRTRDNQLSKVFYDEGTWSQDVEQKYNDENLSGRLMLDYNLTDNTKIGIQYLGTFGLPDELDSGTVKINSGAVLDSILRSNGAIDYEKYSHSINGHFETKLDTVGRVISADLDYFEFDTNDQRNIRTRSVTPSEEFLNIIFANNINTERNVKNLSGRIDIEHPIKYMGLSYGGKLSQTESNYNTANFNTISGTAVFDPTQSNIFAYEESIQSLYVNASKQFSEKWNLQLGIRMESTQTEGFSQTENQTTEVDYVEFFPTFYTTFEPNDDHNLFFSFGRRIERPDFSVLNPARYYANSNSYSEGNPFLQPSFSNNFEIGHTYKGKLSTTVFVNAITNGFDIIPGINPATNETIVTYENFYSTLIYGFSEFYQFKPVSWWNSNNILYALGSNSSIENNAVDAVVQNGLRLYVSTNNTFTFDKDKGIKGQMQLWYNSANKKRLFDESETYGLDLAVRFDALVKNISFSVGVDDVFNSSRATYSSIISGVQQQFQSFPSNRYFRLSLSYSFGNNDISSDERDFGNEDEKERTDN